jgi:predicted permease
MFDDPPLSAAAIVLVLFTISIFIAGVYIYIAYNNDKKAGRQFRISQHLVLFFPLIVIGATLLVAIGDIRTPIPEGDTRLILMNLVMIGAILVNGIPLYISKNMTLFKSILFMLPIDVVIVLVCWYLFRVIQNLPVS